MTDNLQKAINNKYYNLSDLLSNVFAMILILFVILQFRSERWFDLLKYPVLLVGICLWVLLIRNIRIDVGIICVSSIMLLGALFHYIYFADIDLYIIVKLFAVFLPISLILIYSDRMPLGMWTGFVLVLWCYILYSWKRSPDGYLLFFNTSRNYVSIFCILFCLLLTIVWRKNGLDLPILFYIFCFVSSVWAVGRSGIISSIILVAAIGLEVFRREKKNQLLIILIACFFMLVLLMGTNADFYSLIANKFFARFLDSTAAGSNNERMYIYTSYISEIINNPRELLLGTSPETINAVLAEKGGNLHNSFLQFHAYFGLVGLLLYVVMIIKSLKTMSAKGWIYECIVFAVFLFRSLFDYCYPGGIGDIVMWYLLLIPCSSIAQSGDSIEDIKN